MLGLSGQFLHLHSEKYFLTSAVKSTGGTIKITDKAFLKTESKTAGKFVHRLERGIAVIPCQRRGSPSRIIVLQKCRFQSAVGESRARSGLEAIFVRISRSFSAARCEINGHTWRSIAWPAQSWKKERRSGGVEANSTVDDEKDRKIERSR